MKVMGDKLFMAFFFPALLGKKVQQQTGLIGSVSTAILLIVLAAKAGQSFIPGVCVFIWAYILFDTGALIELKDSGDEPIGMKRSLEVLKKVFASPLRLGLEIRKRYGLRKALWGFVPVAAVCSVLYGTGNPILMAVAAISLLMYWVGSHTTPLSS